MTRTGRRPGTPETREDILVAARRAFAERGYEATSLRSIANQVHVDPALLVHYFGSKDGLFLAALEVAVGPSDLFSGLTISRSVMRPAGGQAVPVPAGRRANARCRPQPRSFGGVERTSSNDAARIPGREDARLSRRGDRSGRRPAQASLVVAELIGIAMLRHVVKLDVLGRASNDDLVLLAAPVIEGYLR